MANSEKCAVLTGLLDFFSDRATTHASFVVATTFGLFTILFSLTNIPKTFWAIIVIGITYFALLGLAIYSFLNFGYYAILADITKEELKRSGLNVEYAAELYNLFEDEIKNNHHLYHIFRKHAKKPKGFIYDHKLKLFFVVWLLTVFLPFFYLLFFV